MSKITNFSKIAQAALGQANWLVPSMYPKGGRRGNHWCVGGINGETGESLKIDLKTGQFKDFANPEHKGGDLIALFALKNSLTNLEAARQLERLLDGHSEPVPSDRPTAKKTASLAVTPVPDNAPPAPIKIGAAHPSRDKVGYFVTDSWTYRDAEGLPTFHIVRFENPNKLTVKGKPEKTILPCSYHGARGWRWEGVGGKQNQLFGLEQLAARPGVPVLLVEGEKTAVAAAKRFPDYVVMTWPGGTGQLKKADLRPLAGRLVVYWHDADIPGRNSVAVLTRKLADVQVAKLLVVDPPADLPAGWDLADEVPPSLEIGELLANATAPVASSELLLRDLPFEALATSFYYVVETDQFVHLASGYRAKSPQMNALYGHTKVGMSRALLAHPSLVKVQHLAYRPGNLSRVIRDPDNRQYLNLWVPSKVERVQGDPTLFVEHLRYLCDREEEFEHLVKMLAFMLQHPGRKLRSSIVLVGGQGTGKSFIGHVLRELLGRHNTAEVASNQLKSQFNQYMEAKLLVIVEEIMVLGRVEIMNHLKTYITQDWIMINIKNLPNYEIENFANFLFLSNHEDALKIDNDARRFFIVMSSKPAQSREYYDRLWAWEAQNRGVILDWLLSQDLSDFSPDAPPPATEGKRRMIEASRDDTRRC